MRRIRAKALSAGVACALLGAGAAMPAASAAAAPDWRIDTRLPLDTGAPPQEFSPGDSFLNVAGVGPQDAWAVGVSGRNIGPWGSPVMRHWHDGRWLTPKLPAWMNAAQPGGWVNEFQAVGGSSPDDVWAVGWFDLLTGDVIRAVHWDGQSWAKSVLPTQSGLGPVMKSVLSFGPTDAWAFGCYCEASQSAYIAHYSGGRWRDMTPKGLPFGGILSASAISPSNIWAVMSETDIGTFTVLHWDGTAWATVAVPAKLSGFSPGGGIVATASGGVWFAGSLAASGSPAVARDQGGKWSITPVAADAPLATLIPDGAGGFWSAAQEIGPNSAQLWHESGGAWSQATDPAGTDGFYRITGMTNLPGTQTSLAAGFDMKNDLLLSTP